MVFYGSLFDDNLHAAYYVHASRQALYAIRRTQLHAAKRKDSFYRSVLALGKYLINAGTVNAYVEHSRCAGVCLQITCVGRKTHRIEVLVFLPIDSISFD